MGVNIIWQCSKCGKCCKLAWLMKKEWAMENGSCKYLKDKQCSIYDSRPEICRVKDYTKKGDLTMACEKIRRFVNA